MRRSWIWGLVALCPAVMLAVLVGCGGGAKTDDDEGDGGPSPTKSGGKVNITALEATGTGTLSGKVTLDGDKPNIAAMDESLRKQMTEKDKEHCLAAKATEDEKSEFEWKIDDKGGVANVFVWIAPPKGKYFKIDLTKVNFAKEVTIDQPHCAFVPHAVVTFPKYRDDKGKVVATGQQFFVANSAEMNHNTNLTEAGGPNPILPAGKKTDPLVLQAGPKPYPISCNIHTWMKAYVGVFEHPYAAVTKPDGTYTIENVPTGVEVTLFAWHEKAAFLNEGGGKGQTIKLEAKTEKDFKAKAQ